MTLGDRCKEFEHEMTEACAVRGQPLLARLDGRAFHTFTRGMKRPFDLGLSTCMVETTEYLVDRTHALIGYTQSDEISLVWHVAADSTSELLFGGRFQKIVSVLAGMASAKFCALVAMHLPVYESGLPHFDCRAWQVPTEQDALDVFVWREDDAVKNSVSMLAQAHFSDKQLHGKNTEHKLAMLLEQGVKWSDLPSFLTHGSYVQRKTSQRELTEIERMRIPEKHRPSKDLLFARTAVVTLDMPPIRTVANLRDVVFSGVAATKKIPTDL